MNTHDKRKKLKRKKTKIRLACMVLIVSSLILCGTAFTNMILVDHKENLPQTTAKAPTKSEDISNSNEILPPQTDTDSSEQPEWNLLLVNPWNKLPEDFSADLTNLKNGHAIDKRAYPDLQAMMDAARGEGLSPLICSSYRTNKKQQTLFDNQVKKYLNSGYSQENAEQQAAVWVAIPGTSEHQTGLAVDIVATSYQMLDENQANTPEQKWLMENSYKYGFILRYPVDKSDITGIGYEPWHYRYVGKDAAKEIYTQGICLEEYLPN